MFLKIIDSDVFFLESELINKENHNFFPLCKHLTPPTTQAGMEVWQVFRRQ